MTLRHRIAALASELQRRRIFRLALLYLAAGWLLIQVSGTLFPLFGFAESVTRSVVIVIAAGFPVALVLGWMYDLTSRGVQRTLPVERGTIVLGRFEPIGPPSHRIAAQISHLIGDSLNGLQGLRLAATPEHAAYELSGVVETDEQTVELRVRVTDLRDQHQVMVESFKQNRSNLDLVEELAWPASRAVTRALGISLNGAPQACSVQEAGPLQRAQALLDARSIGALRAALVEYDQLIAANAECAAAHAGRAVALAFLGDENELPRTQAWRSALDAAERARALDPGLAQAYAALGLVRVLGWDWPGTHRQFRRALELDPGLASAHLWLSLYLTALGRPTDALAAAEQARALQPSDPVAARAVAGQLLYTRRYGECVALCESLLSAGGDASIYVTLALAQEQLGSYDASRNTLKLAMQHAGSAQEWLVGALGHVDASAGRAEPAQRALQVMARRESSGSCFVRAALCAALDQFDAAFDQLQRAADEHDGWLLALQVHPWIDPLREDPRYHALLVRLRLVEAPLPVAVA